MPETPDYNWPPRKPPEGAIQVARRFLFYEIKQELLRVIKHHFPSKEFRTYHRALFKKLTKKFLLSVIDPRDAIHTDRLDILVQLPIREHKKPKPTKA